MHTVVFIETKLGSAVFCFQLCHKMAEQHYFCHGGSWSTADSLILPGKHAAMQAAVEIKIISPLYCKTNLIQIQQDI